MRRLLVLLLSLTLAGCPEPDDDDTTAPPLDDDDATADDDDTTDDDDSTDDDDTIDDDDTTPEDPGYPEFPEVIDILTISIRTGFGEWDGTDSNPLSVCLNETACFGLDTVDVNDFRIGEIDVFTTEGAGLARADVDRVEIRSDEGEDRWTPHCMDIRFDGEPVYCNTIDLNFGEEDDELTSWIDPDGLHNACVTCWDEMLTHGPMVGAATDDSARFLLRTDATRRVGLHLGPVGEPDAPVVAWLYPSPATDFAGQTLIEGLAPATTYDYWYEIDDEPAGDPLTFTTAPALGLPTTTRFAFGSCTRYDDQPLFEDIRAADPDLFMFIGDNHYGNTADLNALRFNYRWGLEREHRRELAQVTPTLATWDDHDYVGNNTDGYDTGKEVALRVFNEYWATGPTGTEATPGVFSVHSWADIDLFFLDDRYYREFDDSILGDPQTEWLKEQLLQSSATFKVLLSGSQWTEHGSGDSWAVFLDARDALLDHIRDNDIGGVVLLSGDVHRSEFRITPRASAGGYDIPELVSSPMANSNSGCGSDSELLECFASGNYYITLDFDTEAADPVLVATIWGEDNVVQAEWTILASELQVP